MKAISRVVDTDRDIVMQSPEFIPSTGNYTEADVRRVFSHFMKRLSDNYFVATIDGEMAKTLLEFNTGNRSLSKTTVDFYAKNMKAGEWAFNGDPIRFDKNGTLLDGQHRLAACARTGISFEVLVILDLDPETQLTMDSGRRRTTSENLKLHGVPYASNTSSMMRPLFRLVQGNSYSFRSSHLEALRVYERYPCITDSVRMAAKGGGDVKTGRHTAIISALHFIGSNFMGQKRRADAFVTVCTTVESDYEHDPVKKFIMKYVVNKDDPGNLLNGSDLHNGLVYVYNQFVKSKPLKKLILPSGEQKVEGFNPKLIDLS